MIELGRSLTRAYSRYKASAEGDDPGSWNRYAYVVGDPTNRSDPSGLDYIVPGGQQFDPKHPGNVGPGGNGTTVTASFPTVVTFQIMAPPMWGLGEDNEMPTFCMQRIQGMAGIAVSNLMWDSGCNQFMYPGNPLYEAAMKADQAHTCKWAVDRRITDIRTGISRYLDSLVPDALSSMTAMGLKTGAATAVQGARGLLGLEGIAAGVEGALVGGFLGFVVGASSTVITDPAFWPMAKAATMAGVELVLQDWQRMGNDNCDGKVPQIPEIPR